MIPSLLPAMQFLPVKSIVNARDLGGYPAGDSRKVKDRLLLRSAHLADASHADMAYLEGLHITKVIDFRKTEELAGVTDRMIPGASYVSIPIDASGSVSATAAEKEKFTKRKKFEVKKLIVWAAFNKKAQKVAQDLYRTLLFYPECQKQFAAFMREVVDTPDGAILFHCTQGKDRTGIASMLLLAALGVGKETIVADFDATNQVYAKDVRKYSRRVRFFGGKHAQISVVKSFIGANTENFVNALNELEAAYGSAEEYLKGPIGMTDSDIQTLRERYLV